MVRFRPGTALILLLIAVSASAKPEIFSVSVYIDAAPQAVSPEGFVEGSDKWLRDSVADIKKALDGKSFHPLKGFPGSPAVYAVVSDPAKADIVLTVAARGTSAESLGQRTTMQAYRGVVTANTVPTVGVTRWVSVVLSVGTYRKEIVTWHTNQSRFSAGAWTADAKRHAVEAAGWVMANEARIRERRAVASIPETSASVVGLGLARAAVPTDLDPIQENLGPAKVVCPEGIQEVPFSSMNRKTLRCGETVTIAAQNRYFTRVKTADGLEGYVAPKFLRK